MSYDEKYRARVVEYKDNGHTFVELKEVYGVSSRSYYDWKTLKKETGHYAPKATQKATRKRKISPKELQSAIEEKPDAYLRKLAKQFNCSTTAVHKRLKEMGITYKKRHLLTLKNQRRIEGNILKK